MNVLVMGGTGAIGSPLVDDLLSDGVDVNIVVTSRSYRKSTNPALRYVIGNARDLQFIEKILGERIWDVIVDFMNYDLDEFKSRVDLMLASTFHYIWISSCRVYSDSAARLFEDSPRLLETSTDREFLATNRYALRKARQEDVLKNSGKKNFTIIRPYITYNTERLQLGVLEKEHWLCRLLRGKALVVSEEFLEKETTLTYARDVSGAILDLINRGNPEGEIYQIAGRETISWCDLLRLYCDIIFRQTGLRPKVYCSKTICVIENLWEGGYNTVYDRNYNRRFDSMKIERVLGKKINYSSIREGVTRCLVEFIEKGGKFRHIEPEYEAYQDLLCGEISGMDYFDSEEDFREYMRIVSEGIDGISNLKDIKKRII